MTRIIAGLAGSLKLTSPAKVTRPTSDRIRESIFSRLEAKELIDGAKVLDLYAGTGALALESASRGAAVAWMVERDGKAAAVCVANLKIVAKALLKEEVEFDGKEITNDEIVSELELLKPLLKEATVVLERSSRTEAPNWPDGYVLEDEKSYGDTVVYWLSA